MELPYTIDILEECHVSPPPNSVPTTSIPLTFFDMPWIFSPTVERVLFYEFPHPTLHFIQIILPQLKHSLSLTLQHFFPLAGSLVCPPLPTPPHILYQNGDSVRLTVAESNSDFAHLVENYPREAKKFRPLVPHLSHEITSLPSSGPDLVQPIQLIRHLIALQVTIFPNSGISICYTYRHMLGDGRTINHFIKSWASIFKSKNDLSPLEKPLEDRAAVIKDPNGLLPIICNQLCEVGGSWDDFATVTAAATATATATLQDKLHITLVLDRPKINKLKHWITSQFNSNHELPPLLHISTFVVSCAFVWVCLIKTEKNVEPTSDLASDDDFLCNFGFLADYCTVRSKLCVPKTYCGNCLAPCWISIRKSELLGENGLFIAAKAIMKEVKELDSGLMTKIGTWVPKRKEMFASGGHLLTVAGSPKLQVYETDFGWGKPKKSEVVHIDKSIGAFSLTESRDEEGGVEIGVSLKKVGMDAFVSIFQLDLNNYSC